MKKEIITEIMFILHELKHSGKLPKELLIYSSDIECYNPENIK